MGGGKNKGGKDKGGKDKGGKDKGGKDKGGKGGGSGRGAQPCRNWEADGWCRFGDQCLYQHAGQQCRPPAGKGAGGGRGAGADAQRLANLLEATPPDRLAKQIEGAGELWPRCWELAAASLSLPALRQLVVALAKLPFSAPVPPPPALHCRDALKRFLRHASGSAAPPNEAVQAVDVVYNAVQRLVKFEWETSVDEVKDTLLDVLATASQSLQMVLKDHRDANKRVMDLMTELEKPWAIKQKIIARETLKAHMDTVDPEPGVDEVAPHTVWRTATVGWLCCSETFAPSHLPKMKVPGSKSEGVYDTPGEYLDTVERLMVGMTFSDGNAAVSPRCYQRECGQCLWPIPQGNGLHCRTRNCHGTVVIACSNRNHNDGLCKRCAEATETQLLGPPGPRASTHIYDGTVRHVDADGRIYLCKIGSRCPPQYSIHWRSTKRLQSPNLVGVVRLAARGASLRREDLILWGEITCHGQPFEEARRRQDGLLAINMMSITKDVDLDAFAEGGSLAIVDCMTFVPEYVPALNALEQQRLHSVPFDDGALLNLCAAWPPDLSNTVVGDSDSDLSNVPLLVQDMITESRLQPIVEIRRDPTLTEQLNCELCELVRRTTLDEGQLVSFIDSLRNPVHLTQGPPGTGKSYLGVVLVRALLIVRSLWMRKNHSVGTPPILVLSYKNHAIDEFLVDLVQAERDRLTGWSPHRTSLIRIGGSANGDPRLAAFSEKTFQRADPLSNRCRDKVARLHTLTSTCKALCHATSWFLGYQVGMFGQQAGESQDAQRKRQDGAAYEATEVLLASLMRSKLLHDEIDQEDEEGAAFEDDDQLLERLDFLALDHGDPRGRQIQRRVSSREVFAQIPELHRGIEHYVEMDFRYDDPGEVLFGFIRGLKPLPMCSCSHLQGIPCANLALCHEVPLCDTHRCTLEFSDGEAQTRCSSMAAQGKRLCSQHVCEEPSCQWPRLPPPQRLCQRHACFRCMELGQEAGLAIDDPPRNVCRDHPLCCKGGCLQPCVPKSDYCEQHAWRLWYWMRRDQQDGDEDEFASANDSDSGHGDTGDEMPLPKKIVTLCIGHNRKGKPCGALAMANSKYCHAHVPPDVTFADHQLKATEESQNSPVQQRRWKKVAPVDAEAPASSTKGAAPADASLPGECKTAGSAFADDVDLLEAPAMTSVVDTADAGQYDNPDEVEEADHLQHLREVFQVDDAEDSDRESASSSAEEEGGDGSGEVAAQADNGDLPSPKTVVRLQDPKEWTWEMPLHERWDACQAFLATQKVLLQAIMQKVKAQMPAARRALHSAKLQASAKVYENKAVIGGTIVGCISRLEAIRSTNPFAIVVEEASEVLEPLLFSCLCPSTVKFEMIGDHLQLQPSIMQKFQFERINRVSISMFERLIRAPEGHRVPSAVLALQRRMRKDVCDLTREYYKEIVGIQDHDVCSSKVIPGALAKKSAWKGREVPGIRSHIYLWTHSGDQQKADVGLSKVNRHEAEMAVWLAYYLVASGVPKPSIAILTPYKGQLMLMRNQLLKDSSPDRLLSRDNTEADQIRLSTVDRFQGDEADVVIISLVVDGNSSTPFVKLVNRMIVLLSRARLGMYVLGNVGYFKNSRQDVKHWNRTFELLQQPPAASDSADPNVAETFDLARVGPALPLCCPQHPSSRLEAKEPKDLQVGFCTAECPVSLPCMHACGLQCHWPKQQHNRSCKVPVASPCSKHRGEISCASVFAHSAAQRTDTIAVALDGYRCPEKVSVTMPCMHTRSMACAVETDISEGRAPWPHCDEPAHSPYIYPDCKHALDVTCHQLAEYARSPSSVKKCAQMVDYVPPACGHTRQVKCYLKQQYEAREVVFTCPEKLDVTLPRCGHSKKVSCAEELALRSWTGTRCMKLDEVHEGENYGPKDHNCACQVAFVRKCGHETKMACGEAFEQAKAAVPCKTKVKCANPHCGHPCEVPCPEASRLRAMGKKDPVDSLTEGDIPPIPADLRGIPCRKEVTVLRRCGHKQKLRCDRAQTLPTCDAESPVQSPLCGHAISVPCHLQGSLKAWTPWDGDGTASLVETETLPAGAVPRPDTAMPSDLVAKHLQACGKSVTVVKPCGHSAKFACKQLLKIVQEGEVKGHCSEMVTKPLRCGHTVNISCKKYRDYLDQRDSIPCKEEALRPCWNAAACGNRALPAPCASAATMCCDAVGTWTCARGAHAYEVHLCRDGTPSVCPGCSMDMLSRSIDEVANAVAVDRSLPPCLQPSDTLRLFPLDIPEEVVQRFVSAKTLLLRRFKSRVEKCTPLKQQLFAPKVLPCFFVVERARVKDQGQGFLRIHDFLRGPLRAVQAHCLTEHNLRALARNTLGYVTLLCGYCFTVSASTEDACMPSKKNSKEALNRWKNQGCDCVELRGASGPKPLVVLEPFPLYTTHRVELTRQELEQAADRLGAAGEPPSLAPIHQRFVPPPGTSFLVRPASTSQPADSAAPGSSGATAGGPGAAAPRQPPELRGTPGEGLSFPGQWDPPSLATAGDLPEAAERDLQQSLCFINKDAAPFAGLNVLQGISKSNRAPVLDLLLALQVHSNDAEQAAEYFKDYLSAIHAQVAHPLALLALYRVSGLKEALPAFANLYPSGVDLLLPPEVEAIHNPKDPAAPGDSSDPRASAADPAEMWEELKEAHGCSSEAMDELLKLTGLRKVKAAAVALYKSAQMFQRMSREARKANSFALNYCFLGNPGTGKTTVARLFARVLRDCGLREKDAFEECTAQKLKDDGVDEFRKKAQNAMDGVLFVDEAYDLDPVGDKFKGAPIVNEMVTLTENARDRLTVILAGYEDDMNSKFFAHNTGLKSRFKEVLFEDFDEAELTQIWTGMRTQRGWTEEDPRLTAVSVRRILKGAGRKGFGNAREVRKRLEYATANAMNRPDFEADKLVLHPVDVVGEDPRGNAKLERVLASIKEMTGWAKIKKAVEDLVTVCGTNYKRELDGQAPLPVFLNRMFLGNPGTGKTTCAKLYGQVLKNLGFLSIGDVVFKTAGDLGGSVVGEAQQKTLDVLRSAEGKVLVIDEAYSLDDKLYGKQVLDTLVEKIQGTESDDIAVLLLGYEDQMLAMLRNQNPGLARRFAPEQAFYFEDYSDKELLAILQDSCRRKNVKPTIEFQKKAVQKLGMLRRSEANFGNAGTVNNLLRGALLKASARMGSGEGDVRLEACDVEIGPEGEASGDPFRPLDKLYRMEGVKAKLQQLSNAFTVAQREGGDMPDLGHFVFTGSPGTGKTTVARVMAKILFDLQLIGRNHVVETSGLNLTGEYLGQTKKKVEEKLDSAKGGVLFIDEAYELGRGHYGTEACTTIVAAMTDPKYSGLVIVIAGYPEDIFRMLDTNPGLKSRFTHFFEFPDWEPADCLHLFAKRASENNFDVDPAARACLERGLEALLRLEGWGNARDVDALWKASMRHRADRVAEKQEEHKTLFECDVQPAVDALTKARRSPTVKGERKQSPFPDLLRQGQQADAPAPPTVAKQRVQEVEQEAEEELKDGPVPAGAEGRDPGVSDEIWAELQQAKAEEKAREAQRLHELEELRRAEEERAAELEREWQAELERIRQQQLAEQERQEAERRARAAHEAKLERERLEQERRRQAEERRLAEIGKAKAIQEKLRQISPCPAGFQWYKSGGGWRCGGGSHFVSDAQLNAQFTF